MPGGLSSEGLGWAFTSCRARRIREAELRSFSRQPTCPEACEESVPLLSALSDRRIPFMLCRRLFSQYLQRPCCTCSAKCRPADSLGQLVAHCVALCTGPAALVTKDLPASLQGAETQHECCLRPMGLNAQACSACLGVSGQQGKRIPISKLAGWLCNMASAPGRARRLPRGQMKPLRAMMAFGAASQRQAPCRLRA